MPLKLMPSGLPPPGAAATRREAARASTEAAPGAMRTGVGGATGMSSGRAPNLFCGGGGEGGGESEGEGGGESEGEDVVVIED